MHTLDHLLWEEWTLEEGERRFARLTGVTPVFGGKHAEGGTQNSLLALGESTYLEILAPDHAHSAFAHLPEEPPVAFTPKLMTFGFKTDNMALTKKLIEKAGLKSKVHRVARASPRGEELEWETIRVEGHDFGHFVPFFTRQLKGEHPSVSAPKGCELLELSIEHPNSKALQTIYDALRVDLRVVEAEVARVTAVLATPKGRVTLDNTVGIRPT